MKTNVEDRPLRRSSASPRSTAVLLTGLDLQIQPPGVLPITLPAGR